MKLGSGVALKKKRARRSVKRATKIKVLGAHSTAPKQKVQVKRALLAGMTSLIIIISPVLLMHPKTELMNSVPSASVKSGDDTSISPTATSSHAQALLDDSNVNGFSSDDVDFSSSQNSSFLSDLNSSDDTTCSSGCTVYNRQGDSMRIQCISSGSCTTYSSSGETYNTFCYGSTSCSTYGSDGSSAHTYCYSSSSCSSYDSEGNSAHTYCYGSSSCSTYDSDGDYSHTYCYSSSSCSSYGSDGSSSHTYCYSSSCNTYDSDGSSYSTYGY